MMTVRTGDIDFSSTARHTQPLLALRTFKIPMGLAIPKTQPRIFQTIRYRPPFAEKPLILCIARLNVAREHPKIAQNQQGKDEKAHPSPPSDPLDYHQQQAEQQQRIIELIAAVPSSHKPAQKIHHSTSPFPTWSNMIASTSSRPFPFSAENGITGTSSGSKSVCRISARLPSN